MTRADRNDWEAEAAYAYSEARYYTWPLWEDLPKQVRAWWIAGVRAAASLGSGRVNRRVGPGAQATTGSRTAPSTARYQAGTADPTAGITPPAFAPG